MVLPLIGAVVGIGSLLGILAIFAVIIDQLSLLVAAGVVLVVYLMLDQVDYGLPFGLNMAVSAVFAGVAGFVVYKVFGWVLAVFGLLAALVVVFILLVGGVGLLRAVAGGVVEALIGV